MDDRTIIQLFQSRDEAAISAVREKYGAYCGSVALGITGDEQDAEECVSDALYRLWDSIPPAEPKSLRAFAGRITRNISINRLRDASRQKRGGGLIGRHGGESWVRDAGRAQLRRNNEQYAGCKRGGKVVYAAPAAFLFVVGGLVYKARVDVFKAV